MFTHIGENTVIRREDIIAILDSDTSTVSARTRKTLSAMEKRGEIIPVGTELPKSFILCRDKKGNSKVFLSPFSVQTLLKRMEEL